MTLPGHNEAKCLQLAIRVTVASAICASVSFLFHLSFEYLSPVLASLALIIFHGRVFRVGVPGAVAVFFAGTVSLVIFATLFDAPIAYVITKLSWLLLWMAFLRPLPFGHLIGGIVISMMLLVAALGTVDPRDLFEAFFTQVCLGVVVASIVEQLLWPPERDDALYEALGALFADFASDLASLGATLRDGRVNTAASVTELSQLARLSTQLGQDTGKYRGVEFELVLRCRLIWDRLHAIKRLIRSTKNDYSQQDRELGIQKIFETLAAHFAEMSNATIERRKAPSLPTELRENVARFCDWGQNSASENFLARDADVNHVIISRFLRTAVRDHDKLERSYNILIAKREGVNGSLESPVKGRFFSWPTPEDWKSATKVVIIAFILLIGVLYLDFPGSAMLSFYGIVFGLAANIGQLYMKSISGAYGIFFGLVYGVVAVFIVSHSPHFPVLIGLFCLGMFVSAYLASGAGAKAFMGLQAALVIPFVFLVFDGPEWTLEDGVTRALALLVAAAIAILIQHLFWPVKPLLAFRAAAAAELDEIDREWALIRNSVVSEHEPEESFDSDTADKLVVRFGQSASLLEDSRYAFGSDNQRAAAHFAVLESLEAVYAEIRLLRRLLRRCGDKPFVKKTLQTLTGPFDDIAAAIGILSENMRDETDPNAVIGVLHGLQGACETCMQVKNSVHDEALVTSEDRWQTSVLLSTVYDIATTLSQTANMAIQTAARRQRVQSPMSSPSLASAVK